MMPLTVTSASRLELLVPTAVELTGAATTAPAYSARAKKTLFKLCHPFSETRLPAPRRKLSRGWSGGKVPQSASLRSYELEKRGIRRSGRGAHMSAAELRHDPPPRRPLNEAELEEVGLVDVLDRVG